MKSVQGRQTDIVGFIDALGGIRCRDQKEMEVATDSILLEGKILQASRQLDALLRKARRAGLFASEAA